MTKALLGELVERELSTTLASKCCDNDADRRSITARLSEVIAGAILKRPEPVNELQAVIAHLAQHHGLWASVYWLARALEPTIAKAEGDGSISAQHHALLKELHAHLEAAHLLYLRLRGSYDD